MNSAANVARPAAIGAGEQLLCVFFFFFFFFFFLVRIRPFRSDLTISEPWDEGDRFE